MTDLTPKQELFVKEFSVDRNGTQAAIRAGYAPNSAHVEASRMLKLPKVAAAIAENTAQVAARIDLSTEWVLEQLMENVRRAMQQIPVLDRKGEPTGEWTYNGAVANKALELLGKHLGMFSDRVDIAFVQAESQRIADELGLNPDDVMREAEAILKATK